MKNKKMAEAAARYGMTARAFELLLVELGWIVDGAWLPHPVESRFATEKKEITQRGLSYLDGYLWRRRL